MTGRAEDHKGLFKRPIRGLHTSSDKEDVDVLTRRLLTQTSQQKSGNCEDDEETSAATNQVSASVSSPAEITYLIRTHWFCCLFHSER